MTTETLLVWSGFAERFFFGATALLLLWGVGKGLVLRSQLCRSAERPTEREFPSRREYALLGSIVLLTLLLRLTGTHATFWFTFYNQYLFEKEVVPIGWFSFWRKQWWLTHVNYSYQGVFLLPFHALLHTLGGVLIEGHRIVGSFWGALTVIAGWWFGRTVFRPQIGLLFGFFLAVSPLQIVWSQLGDYYNSAVAVILFSSTLGFRAGKNRSLSLALLTGGALWCSLYFYFLARFSFLLAPICLFFGALLSERQRDWRTSIPALLALLGVGIGVLSLLFGGESFGRDFWPEYDGYVGWRAASVWEEISQNLSIYWREFLCSLELFFVRKRLFRIGSSPIPLRWGVDSGGLTFGIVLLLGVVGLLSALLSRGRERIRALIPLALGAVGLLVTVLSITTPRRLLLFDGAWCLFAALGTAWLMQRWCGPKFALPALFTLLPLWSFGVVQILHYHSATLRIGGIARVNDIPFGQGWIGDGVTCYRCADVAREWFDEFQKNTAVLLIDSDRAREDPASPAGLNLLGKLAALSAGRPENFLRFYPILENSSGMPLFRRYYTEGDEFTPFLQRRLEDIAPKRLVVYSERPTQWERWLMGEIAQFGTSESFPTPLSETTGLRVEIERERIPEVIALLARFEERMRVSDDDEMSLSLTELSEKRLETVEIPWVVALRGEKLAAATSFFVRTQTDAFRELAPITSMNFRSDDRLSALAQYGALFSLDLSSNQVTKGEAFELYHSGFSCFAQSGEVPLRVDPVLGELVSKTDLSWLPREPWMGVSVTERGHFLLASAAQRIFVVDPHKRVVVRLFEAPVWPSLRLNFGECAMLVAGEGWIGSFSPSTSRLALFSEEGTPLATVALDRRLKYGGHFISAIGGSGDRLAIGSRLEKDVRVFQLGGSVLSRAYVAPSPSTVRGAAR